LRQGVLIPKPSLAIAKPKSKKLRNLKLVGDAQPVVS
jgi:hypothetical protein